MRVSRKYTSILGALLVGASLHVAAAGNDGPAGAVPRIDWAKAGKFREALEASSNGAQAAVKRHAHTGVAVGGAQPAEAFANPSRAYPPSCLESPMQLGLWQNDPNALQSTILLGGDPLSGDSNEQAYSETVTLTLFRVVCSSGVSASLLEIDRPANMNGNTSRYPTFPGVALDQGSLSSFVLRMADDPNTFFVTTYSVSPFIYSDVFVLERYYGDSVPDYNQAYTLTVDNLLGNGFAQSVQFPLGDYVPSDYAEASQPLKVNGYMTTTWTNPNQNHEGIFLQVYDTGDNANRVLAYAWFTYDQVGAPFWLYGQSDPFPIGSRTVTATTAYYGGGFFAPAGMEPAAPQTIWGSVIFSFKDCNTMNLTYNGTASAVGGPTGTGARTFGRVASVNSLACE